MMQTPGQEHSKEARLVLVEYPGRVENPHRALERLAFKPDGSVELRFDPRDLWRPPIIGERVSSTPRLLIRVPKGLRNGGAFAHAEVVGRIEETCQFRRLADFTLAQKGPDLPLSDLSRLDPIAIARLGERLITNDAPDPAELCYPPPRFTPSHFPYFPPSAGGAAGSAKDGLAQKRTRKGVWSCSFGDPQIPQAPPADLLNRVRRLHRTEFDKLSRLFAERPVWLRSALRLYFPEIGFNELRMVMPAIAYFFMDGPWRCCWVRYGYDPRKDPIARTYQELEIRSAAIQAMIEMFPSALRKAAASHPAQYVFDGIHINEAISQFQYCDLTFPPLHSIITDPRNFTTACDRREGWYVEGTISRLRQIIKDRWFELVRLKDPAFYGSALLQQSMSAATEQTTDGRNLAREEEEETTVLEDDEYEIYE